MLTSINSIRAWMWDISNCLRCLALTELYRLNALSFQKPSRVRFHFDVLWDKCRDSPVSTVTEQRDVWSDVRIPTVLLCSSARWHHLWRQTTKQMWFKISYGRREGLRNNSTSSPPCPVPRRNTPVPTPQTYSTIWDKHTTQCISDFTSQTPGTVTPISCASQNFLKTNTVVLFFK